jgi:RND family efflux transporter MFP subunit
VKFKGLWKDRGKTLVIHGATLLFLLGLNACARVTAEGPPPAERTVGIVKATFRELPDQVQAFGSLASVKKVEVKANQDGVLEEFPLREGDPVSEGDLLGRIRNDQIPLAQGRAQIALAEAQAARDLSRSRLGEGRFQAEGRIMELEKTEAELVQAWREFSEEERKTRDQEALFSVGGITEEALRNSRFSLESFREKINLMERDLEIRRIGLRDKDLAEAGYPIASDAEERKRQMIHLATASLRAQVASAEAQVSGAQKELESTTLALSELEVRCPLTGRIGLRYVERGERVKKEDPLVSVMDDRSLYGIFPVQEKEALRIKEGMEASIAVDGTESSYPAVVDLVYPGADTRSYTFTVRLRLNQNGRSKLPPLKPGMFARLTLTLGTSKKVLVIPETSVMDKRDDQGRVFLYRGGTLTLQAIQLGVPLGAQRQIVGGLQEGDLVVDKPDGKLREGNHVRPVE